MNWRGSRGALGNSGRSASKAAIWRALIGFAGSSEATKWLMTSSIRRASAWRRDGARLIGAGAEPVHAGVDVQRARAPGRMRRPCAPFLRRADDRARVARQKRLRDSGILQQAVRAHRCARRRRPARRGRGAPRSRARRRMSRTRLSRARARLLRARFRRRRPSPRRRIRQAPRALRACASSRRAPRGRS